MTAEISNTVCIANISPRERQKRLNFGLLALGIGVVLLVFLLGSEASRWWRLVLLLPFFGGMVGIFQWRDKTCIALANSGTRKLGETTETVDNAAELAQIRKQARWVQVKALATALVLTLIAFALPA